MRYDLCGENGKVIETTDNPARVNAYRACCEVNPKLSMRKACTNAPGYDGRTCGELYTCCDCGGESCGCAYCWSCNACEACMNDNED